MDDGPYYLDSATDIASGLGYHDPHLPRGYPHALAALDSLGLHSSAAIIGLNLVCMAIGLLLIGSVASAASWDCRAWKLRSAACFVVSHGSGFILSAFRCPKCCFLLFECHSLFAFRGETTVFDACRDLHCVCDRTNDGGHLRTVDWSRTCPCRGTHDRANLRRTAPRFEAGGSRACWLRRA